MKSAPGIVLIVILVFFSCSPKGSTIITYDLSRSDYTEVIAATGTIEAVNSLSIMPPQDYYGVLTVEWARPEGSRVEPGDTICLLKSDDLRQMLDELTVKLETLRADLKKLEADNALNLAVLEARLKENQAGMSINQLDSVQMQFAPPVKKRLMELELAKARVAGRKLERKFLAEKAIDETEIRQMRSRIIQAEIEVQTMQERVKGLTVLAPSAGILTASKMLGRIVMMNDDGSETSVGGYPKPGAMIFPELPLMSLPDLSEMQISIELQEVDYKRIEKGQVVAVTVDAAGGLRTTGSVKSKSMAPKTKYSGASKMKYYDLIIGVDSCHSLMAPGLSARCTILISQVRDTVVVPTLAIFEKDSLKIVYVAGGGKFRPVSVGTGPANGSQTIITSGLIGSETIALVEPPQNFIQKPKNSINE
ncbi:MAG: hypothetical protein R6V75_04475 [Bacteroidales bacterium]